MALYLIDFKPNPELRTSIYLIYFPTVDIADSTVCCALPASQLCIRIRATAGSWDSSSADTSCGCSTGCSRPGAAREGSVQPCPSEPRGGRWTSALRWGTWGSPAVQPNWSRGARAGHSRGGLKATARSRWTRTERGTRGGARRTSFWVCPARSAF